MANDEEEVVVVAEKVEEKQDEGPKKFKFPSHQSHMVSLAKMCQENKEFTDCIIQCGGVKRGDYPDDDDNEDDEEDEVQKLKAHRLVLGAVSPFLKLVFSEIPPTLPEATILVPGVKKRVVAALLDFLYTGEMTVKREDTAELQHLIETLQIDPELITVDVVEPKSDHQAKNDQEERREKEEEEVEGTPSVTITKCPDERVATKRRLEDKDSDDNDKDVNESSSVKIQKIQDDTDDLEKKS